MSRPAQVQTVAHDDEREPLLVKKKKIGPTPLPKAQLGLLFFIRATDPICFYVIFPFVNQMLLDVGGVNDPSQTGYRAGLVESLFSFAQLLTIFHWGALSDRIGRKPTLLLGCAGSSISAIAFGFSRSFWMMCFARILTGLMNGNVAVLKCALAEITDSTNQARAVSLFPICLNAGMIIGSFIGGTFANTREWSISRSIPLFSQFPYLLPMLLSSLFPLISGTAAIFYLEETLPPKPAKPDYPNFEEAAIDQGVPNIQETPTKSALREVLTPTVILVTTSFAIQSFLLIALGALLPLFCFVPIQNGGLGLGPEQIGLVISARSVSVLTIQVLIFPPLVARLGLARLHFIANSLWIPVFALLPMANVAARAGQEALQWTFLAAFILTASMAGVCQVCNLLMTNNAAPRPELLGTLNGFSQMVGSTVGVIGPGGANSLFAFGVASHILGGNLVWVVGIALGLVGAFVAFQIDRSDRRAAQAST